MAKNVLSDQLKDYIAKNIKSPFRTSHDLNAFLTRLILSIRNIKDDSTIKNKETLLAFRDNKYPIKIGNLALYHKDIVDMLIKGDLDEKD